MWLLPFLQYAQAFRFVENEHPIPGIFSNEQYQVQFVPYPVSEIENNVAEDRLMHLSHLGTQYTCLLPDAINFNKPPQNANKTAVETAREVIKNLNKHELMEFDDVWGWQFELGSKIIQFLPKRTFADGMLQLKIGKGFTTVGRSSNITNHNLNTTEPRLVGDKLMMRATFDQGSICDLSLLPRVSYLYFTCSNDCGDEPVCLLRASEPESNCKYEFVLGVKELCTIPDFVKHHSVSNTIFCGVDDYPIDEIDQIEINSIDNDQDHIDQDYIDQINPVENDPVENDPVDNGPVDNDPVDNDPVDNVPVDNVQIGEKQ